MFQISASLRASFSRLAAVVLLLLCITQIGSAAARAETIVPAHSTPNLIDQAFSRGELSSDQRLLYLFYAVYDSAKLPPQFHGEGAWSATSAVREINQARQNLDNGTATFSSALRAALQTPRLQAATVCDAEDGPNVLETTNFHIVYGAINGLTIQQYADSLEKTFATLITSYGWAEPPLSSNNPFQRYPVQIASIGDEVLGYVTSSGGNYADEMGDNPNTPAVETQALVSCMVLNDDMVQFGNGDPTSVLAALEATIAHEYTHSIQMGYSDPGDAETIVWGEATATYVEDEVYPDAHNNYGYLYPNLTNSLPSHNGNNAEYSMWPLFRYAAERSGGLNTPNGGEAVMQALWANIGQGQTAITAFDNALKAKGSNLNQTFHNFAISLRFLKPCTSAAPYCFSDGPGMLSYMGNTLPANQGQVNAVGGSYNGTIRNTYAANSVGLPATGAYSIQLANTAAAGILRASVVAEVGNALIVTSLPVATSASPNAVLASYTVPTGATRVVLVITNEQVSSDGTFAANAYRVSTGTAAVLDEKIYLPFINK